jgi:GntR family transcriptional regulator
LRGHRFFHPYPKYLQIADILRRRIRTQMQPGDRVPPEVSLSRSFGVSRETIRQAFELLENERLISRRQGQGTFVTARQMSRASEKFTGMVDEFPALGIKTTARVIAREVVKADEEVAGYLKLEKGTLIVRIDRLRILEEQPFAYHSAFLPAEIESRIRSEALEHPSIVHILANMLRFTLEEDRQIIEADLADVTLAEYLDVPIGSPLLLLRRLYITSGERPLAYFKSYYRADRYMYTVKLRQPVGRPRTLPPPKGRPPAGRR